MRQSFIIFTLLMVFFLGFCLGDDDIATVNCTKMGTVHKCCEADGCTFLNCTDGDRCEFMSVPSEGCETATDQCAHLLTTAAPPGDGSENTNDSSTTEKPTTQAPPTTASSPTTPGNTSTAAPTTQAQNTTTTENPTTVAVTSTVAESGTTENTGTSMSSSTAAPHKCGRKFDAPSFVGGMILMLGVLAIIFFACRFYKSKTEMRYQQF